MCAFSTIALHVHAEAICFAHQSRSLDSTKEYLQREMSKGFYPPHFQLFKNWHCLQFSSRQIRQIPGISRHIKWTVNSVSLWSIPLSPLSVMFFLPLTMAAVSRSKCIHLCFTCKQVCKVFMSLSSQSSLAKENYNRTTDSVGGGYWASWLSTAP